MSDDRRPFGMIGGAVDSPSKPRGHSPPVAEVRTAIRVGRITAMAGTTRREIERIAAGLSVQGYTTAATPHFVVCRQPAAPKRALILHAFDEETLDEDLAGMVGEELGPIVFAANSSAIVSGKVGHSRSTP